MNSHPNPAIPALRGAIRVAGSQQKLAAIVGKAQGHVSHWLTKGLPSGYAPAIEKATGVPVEQLCPGTPWKRVPDDSWPNPDGRPLIDVAHAKEGMHA